MDTARLIETVKLAQAGDEAAQQDLYMDSGKHIYYLALKMLKNPDDAEDMTQEVYITVHEKVHELKEPAAFYRWIKTIAVHKCNNLLSRRREFVGQRRDEAERYDLPDEDVWGLPDKAYDDAETRTLIMEVVDGLPDTQRLCIYAHYFHQLPVADIAQAVGVSENTVKTRLSMGRGKIKEALLRKEREEGIKLYAAPLALTPIMLKALEEFAMPQGLAESMWQRITQSGVISAGGESGASAARPDGGAKGGDAAPKDPPSETGPPQADAPQAPSSEAGPDAAQPQGGAEPGAAEPGAQQADASQADTPQAEPSGADGQAPDTSSPGEAPQAMQPKGNDNMNSPNNNTQPRQPGQNPQGQNPYQQQPGQFSQQGPPAQPQQGFPQGQQPGQYAQPQGYPQQAAPQAQPQPYNAMPQGAPGTPPAMGAAPAAQAAGATAAKAGMTLGAKIGIAAASVVAVAGLAVAGVLLLPGLLGSSADASAPPAQSVADGDTATVPTMPDGFAEEHEIPIEVDGELQTATYEGEYKDGQFSGYGVWVFHNYRYEGYWENGMPNGEGILYCARPLVDDGDPYTHGSTLRTLYAHFVNGRVDGNMVYTWVLDNGETPSWAFSVDNGYTGDRRVGSLNSDRPLRLSADTQFGVPPWVSRNDIYPDVPAPDGGAEYRPEIPEDVDQYLLPDED